MRKTELTLEAVRDAIAFIPADDRDLWVKVGMALKDEYGDDARDIWFDWSAGATSYTEQAATHVWKSIKASGKVTIGTLVYEAKQFGWKPKKGDAVKITPEEFARKQAERERRRAEDEQATREKAERAAKRAAELWQSAEPATEHPYLTRKGIQPHGTRVLKVWERKVADESGRLTTVSVLNVLLVPIYAGPKTIATLQAIFPAHNEALGRDKDYLPGGHKQGGYFTIGTISKATLRVVICEGLATGASIHEATGYPVLVAFDAGNLQSVAETLRAKLPDVEIVIAGDNDLWTKGNPGARKANAAAYAVSGKLALPVFADPEDEPTDFNDLRDPEEIRAQIHATIDPIDPEHYTPACLWRDSQPAVDAGEPSENTGSGPLVQPPGGEAAAQKPPPDQPAPPVAGTGGARDSVASEETMGLAKYFTIKGYDHERYYVMQHERKQLAVLSAGSFTDAGFLTLAPLEAWQTEFSSAEGRFSKKQAMNWFIRLAHSRGIYDPSLTRGRGAWVDRGRIVLHMGNKLVVDGVETDITDFKSRYVYELDRSLPKLSSDPLTSEEGEELLETAMMFRWTKPASGPMLVGWCALAPLCGALRWRPHIWITGGAGTGKSWVLNNFVHPLMNGMAEFAQGNSTEAGIRQKLRQDALPVLFDESEKNNERERQRMDGVLALIRQSSTESAARTLKGSANGDAMQFHIRSMFCLASVQVGMEHQADYERLAVLSLRPKRDDASNSAARWKALQERVYRIVQRDEDVAARIFRRSLNLLPITLQNIDIFATAAAQKFGSQRDGDQYGTLMAGAWSLISDRVATPQEAREMLDSYEWSDFMDHTESDDSVKALSAVMGAHVRMPAGLTLTVYELLMISQGHNVDGADGVFAGAALATLGRYGIKVDGNELLFANSCNALTGLISHTPYAADLRGQLLRLPGAKSYHRPIYVSGITTRAVSIPLQPLLNSIKNFEVADDPYHDRPF